MTVISTGTNQTCVTNRHKDESRAPREAQDPTLTMRNTHQVKLACNLQKFQNHESQGRLKNCSKATKESDS